MLVGIAERRLVGYPAFMSRPTNTIERAYQIAKSGRCVELQDVRRQLIQEGYEGVEAHLSGGSIKRDLRALIKAARTPSAAEPDRR